MLIFENYPFRPATAQARDASSLEFVPVAVHDTTHYDLDLTVIPGTQIAIKFTFNLQAYRADQMRRTALHLGTVIELIISDPARLVRDIAILPDAEQSLLASFNPSRVDYPRQRSFIDLFEEQAERVPDAIAVRCGGEDMSYRELDNRANHVAGRLLAAGVGPGVAVGVCVERSIDMIVGTLAVMKAAGVFVPLDPDYPERRLAFIIADAGVAVLLTSANLSGRLPAHAAAIISLDGATQPPESELSKGPARDADPERIAYVIYTSGSTGRPKGVAVAHGNITNLAFALREAYRLDEFPVDCSRWQACRSMCCWRPGAP